jgi:tungstate transport system substrate-binding protein
MYNDFILIGPKRDSAGIKGMTDVARALKAIKDQQATFISRGDHSGTHLRELALWKTGAGINIEEETAPWYKPIERGMKSSCRLSRYRSAARRSTASCSKRCCLRADIPLSTLRLMRLSEAKWC